MPSAELSTTVVNQQQLTQELFCGAPHDLTDWAVLANLANDGRNLVNIVSGVDAVGNSGAAKTIDFANGRVHTITLTANCTLTLSGSISGHVEHHLLVVTQDGTGSRTITWPAEVHWAGGSAPTLSTGAAAVDVIELVTADGGTNIYGRTYGLNFS